MPPWLCATQTSSRIGGMRSRVSAWRSRIFPTTGPLPCVITSSLRLASGSRACAVRARPSSALGGAADVFRMGGVAADRDQQRFEGWLRHRRDVSATGRDRAERRGRGGVHFDGATMTPA